MNRDVKLGLCLAGAIALVAAAVGGLEFARDDCNGDWPDHATQYSAAEGCRVLVGHHWIKASTLEGFQPPVRKAEPVAP